MGKTLTGYFFDLSFLVSLFLMITIGKSEGLDYFLLSLFLLYCCFEVFFRTRKFYFNSHQWFFSIALVFGVFVIEFFPNFYLYEIDSYSRWTGQFGLICIIVYFFQRSTSIVLPDSEGRVYQVQYRFSWYLIFVGFFVLFCFFVFLIYGNAISLRVDRFIFDKKILGIFGSLTNIGYYFCFGLGILFFLHKKKTALFLFVCVFFVFVLKGHKFGTIFDILFLFLFPFFCFVSSGFLKKIIIPSAFGVGGLVSVAILFNLYLFPSFNVANYVSARLAQEGQLWWAISGNDNYEENRSEEMIEDFSYYFKGEEFEYKKHELESFKIMRMVTPVNIFERKIENFSRYTNSLHPLLYFYFDGITTVFVFFIMGLIKGLGLVLMRMVVLRSWIFESIILSRIFFIQTKVFKDADFYKVFSMEFVILLGILFFMIFIRFSRVDKDLS